MDRSPTFKFWKASFPVLGLVVLLVGCGRPPTVPETSREASSTFEQRKADFFALDFPAEKMTGEAKHGMPYAMARLHQSGGRDTEAIAYTVEALAQGNDQKRSPDGTFGPIGVIRVIYTFPDAFTRENLDRIAGLAREIGDWTGGGTENHRLMRWSNGYLLARKFGGQWRPGNSQETVPAEALMRDLKNLLIEEIRWRFSHGGMSEYLSPNYLAVHIIPLLNLYDFSDDPELREAAGELVTLHLAELALNSHRGYILEPHARSGGTQFTGPTLRTANGSQYLGYIYWGNFEPGPARLLHDRDLPQIVYPFLSSYRPPDHLQALATGEGVTPFETRSACVNWPHRSDQRYPRTTLRSVYRTPSHAIGTGNLRYLPDGFYLQHSLFGIAWTSDQEAAFLQCGHNYFHSDLGPLATWKAPLSPFQQTAHHKNSAIVVFNIPMADPWPQSGRGDWLPHRDAHAGKLIDHAMIRFPKTITDRVWKQAVQGDGRWLFLADGDTYLAIRSLTNAEPVPIDENFDGVRSVPRKNGGRSQSAFLFEVGDRERYGSFDDFQEAMLAAKVECDWGQDPDPAPHITYHTPDNDILAIQYNNNLTPGPDGVVENLPFVKVNGEPLDFQAWPYLEGPGVSLNEPGTLNILEQEITIP